MLISVSRLHPPRVTVKSQYEYDFRPFLVAHIRMVRSSVKIFAEKLSKHHDFTHRCMGESLLGTSELGVDVTSDWQRH